MLTLVRKFIGHEVNRDSSACVMGDAERRPLMAPEVVVHYAGCKARREAQRVVIGGRNAADLGQTGPRHAWEVVMLHVLCEVHACKRVAQSIRGGGWLACIVLSFGAMHAKEVTAEANQFKPNTTKQQTAPSQQPAPSRHSDCCPKTEPRLCWQSLIRREVRSGRASYNV